MKPIYKKEFLIKILANPYFEFLKTLPWLSETQNRQEYFMADTKLIYTYSNRSYTSMPWDQATKGILGHINKTFGTEYNVCFLNRYDSYKDCLGYHADDSPEMDKTHPICVLSLGQEREIYWKEKAKGSVINKVLLEHASLFIMPAGFQENHLHKILRHNNQDCSTRISLTFRKYIKYE